MRPKGSGTFGFRYTMDNVLTIERTFGEEHIVSMFDTPLELVKAPGTGYVLVPLGLTIVGHTTGNTPYSAGGTIFLQIGTAIAACNVDATILTNTDDSWSFTVEFALSALDLRNTRNQPIVITNDTQAFADGTDSTVDIFLVYQLVKLTS